MQAGDMEPFMNLDVQSPSADQASRARPEYLKSKSACCQEKQSTSSTRGDDGRLKLPSLISTYLLEIGSNGEAEESLSHDGEAISVVNKENKKIKYQKQR